jgi:predicted dehydrogenase
MKRYARESDITVGVIGYGGAFNMGKAHLEGMRAAGMTPTAVVEIDPSRLEVAAKDYPGIECYDSVAAMLRKSKVNLLAVITPHNTHAKLALQCLKAGRHVVCEKPLAITTAECDAMIREAKRRGLVLSTYHNRHWDGCILEAVRRIRDNREIGEVYRVEAHMGGRRKPGDWWRSSKSVSGGILYDWGVHLLEYCLQVLGDAKIAEVSGYAHRGFWADQTRWKKDTNEDEGFASVRFDNGVWLTLCISSLDSNPKRGIVEFTGTTGSYVMDHQTFEIQSVDGDRTTIEKGRNPKEEGWKFYRNVADHLVKGEALVITPEWSRRPIHILDLADRSVKAGKALKATYR